MNIFQISTEFSATQTKWKLLMNLIKQPTISIPEMNQIKLLIQEIPSSQLSKTEV